ncbi:pimeloyl-ACP methyl ester carboxylesterase [Kordia periserrulae]|uniref:Pimeloyl-ACP methyl ester carboxylesterase n=1 Tax=Kordia periserrulae TaxID=701523 RepID=A0A2T6BTT2_9FLAO|nr:alpha/beta fold hydrolase [Kordia periserrulae]PTX59491.1 pimeloyl-ACP methyl ester carboxylesterase [Kordia periserrulae]
MIPKIQYTKSGNLSIAYQVFGSGPVDLVYIPGWVSNIDWMWACPELVDFFEELGKVARIILFDKRGTGLSDRIVELSTLEERMEDIKAVMDATNSKKAILFGHSEGGSVSALFSATYPNRVLALITFGIFAKRRYSEDYPWAPTDEERQKVYDMIEHNWGSGEMNLESLVPSKANDEQFMSWLASYFRSGASPRAALKLTKMNTQVNIIDILEYIKVPTLLMQRTNDIDVKIEEGKFIAERIKGAKFVEFDGNDHLFWAGNTQEVLEEMKTFIRQLPSRDNCHKKRLTTMLFGHVLTAANQGLQSQVLEESITEKGGKIIIVEKKFFVASFEVPSKAISAGISLLNTHKEKAIPFAAGIYMKESDDNQHEPLSHRDNYMITSILSLIKPNRIVVTQAIKHLLSGVAFNFSKDTSILTYQTHQLCTLYHVTDKSNTHVKTSFPYGFSKYDSFLEDVLKIIDEHLDNNNFGVEMLTKETGVSERKLQRRIKETTGKSPGQLITFIRLNKAKSALVEKTDTVAEIAFKFGFSSPSYFSKCFKKEFGIRPTEVVATN